MAGFIMATTTPNNGWAVPTSTDYVKDGATAIETLGDAIDASVGTGLLAWTSYTPIFRTGADTKTATINYAKYCKIGKTLFAQVRLTATQVGTASGSINVSLPAGFTYQNSSSRSTHGTFQVLDNGTAFYSGVANCEDSVVKGTAYNSIDNMGVSAPTMTIAINDQVSFSITVEVA
jgi:hypothetical protein